MIFSSPLPLGAGVGRLIRRFLTPAECAEWIALSEGRGYASAASDYPPTYRNNDRQVLDAPALAARLGERLRAHAPASMQANGRTRLVTDALRHGGALVSSAYDDWIDRHAA